MGRNKKSTCRPIIDTRTKSSDESAFLSRKECMRESLSATEPLALPFGHRLTIQVAHVSLIDPAWGFCIKDGKMREIALSSTVNTSISCNDTHTNGAPRSLERTGKRIFRAYHHLSYGNHRIIAAPSTNTPTKAPNAMAISTITSLG